MSEHDASQEVLRLQGLKKSYNVGKPTEVEVLHGLDLRLQRSDFAALFRAWARIAVEGLAELKERSPVAAPASN